MLPALLRFLRNSRGAAALSFVIMAPVMLGGIGLAVDYSTYRLAQTRLQAAADAGALAAVADLSLSADDKIANAIDVVGRNTPDGYGTVTQVSDVTIGTYSPATGFVPGAAPSANAVKVMAIRSADRGNAAPRIFSLFLSSDALTISATAIAARPNNVFYEPPALTNLDNEAGDFNELYVYCYDTNGTGAPESRRSQMTLMSNNMPANRDVVAESGGIITANPPAPENLVWPRCDTAGQTLSFRLRNIRQAKSMPYLWANPGDNGGYPGRTEYNHYTDTTVVNGHETFGGLNGQPDVETVRCDTLDQCNTGKPGNIIPQGSYRMPQLAAQGCEPGKFMYFGWEDRPPGQPGASASWTDPAWTDQDYNDIVVVMKCPRSGQLGDNRPRLVG